MSVRVGVAEEAFGPEDGARVARGLSAANVGIDPVADSAGNGVSAQEGLRVAVLDTYQSKHGAAPHFARQQTLAVAPPAQLRPPRTERIKVTVRFLLLGCLEMVLVMRMRREERRRETRRARSR